MSPLRGRSCEFYCHRAEEEIVSLLETIPLLNEELEAYGVPSELYDVLYLEEGQPSYGYCLVDSVLESDAWHGHVGAFFWSLQQVGMETVARLVIPLGE